MMTTNKLRQALLRRFAVLTSALWLALSNLGCGQGKADVSGIVRFKGEPLPYGRITFFSQQGHEQSYSATIDDGAFCMYGVPQGPARITVETFPPLPIFPVEQIPGGKAYCRDMEEAMRKAGMKSKTKEGPIKPGPHSGPDLYVPLPARYKDAAKSGLTHDVIPGPQTKDFDLYD